MDIVSFKGDSLNISFNLIYLIEFLKVVKSEIVMIWFIFLVCLFILIFGEDIEDFI